MPFITPKRTCDALGDAALISNPLLQCYTLAPTDDGSAGSEDWKHRQYDRIAKSLSDDAAITLVENLAKRQRLAAKSLAPAHVRSLILELDKSEFTAGLSSPTVLENGMILLRPYGIPVVPGSEVKGIAASWLAEILADDLNLRKSERDKKLENAGLLPLFGEAHEEHGVPGCAVFFDALPRAIRTPLAADITTVHYRAYDDGTPPSGCENPNPIPFPGVRRGTKFQFCFGVRDCDQVQFEKLRPEQIQKLGEFGIEDWAGQVGFLQQLLASTALYKGFGAQTAIGYGHWKRAGAVEIIVS